MSPRILTFTISCFLLIAALPVSAQAPATTPRPASTPRPVEIFNGDFARSSSRQDIWSGVDSSGFLIGARASVNLLTTAGGIGQLSVAPSVAVGDVNTDGLADIVTADAQGYLRIYFNQGTPTEPKFGFGEVAAVYLSPKPKDLHEMARLAPRVSLFNNAGLMHVIVGNYNGEILMLKNEGSPARPLFRQPADFSKILLPTTEKPGRRWGNLFAPLLFDWNSDGKPDLLIGEGSYSANNIHLAINQGSAASPKFTEAQRTTLAFGDGREQLTPAIVDYNGNGKPDLLIAARDGKIGLHLHPETPWKPGDEVKFTSFLVGTGGAELSLGGGATLAVGDLNGDGLFDIVAGKPNGRLSVVFNSGTKTEPKFTAVTDLKSEVKSVPNLVPIGWDVNVGFTRGNILADAIVVKAADEPQLGLSATESALRIGYAPNANKIMGPPFIAISSSGNFQPSTQNTVSRVENLTTAPSNYASIRQELRSPLVPGKPYTISFKVRGNRVSNATCFINATGSKRFGEDRKVEGERGRVAVQRNTVEGRFREAISFSPSGSWTEVKKAFTVKFNEKELSDLDQTRNALIDFSFQLAPGDGVLYIKDVKIEG
jgi:hypothetical protein